LFSIYFYNGHLCTDVLEGKGLVILRAVLLLRGVRQPRVRARTLFLVCLYIRRHVELFEIVPHSMTVHVDTEETLGVIEQYSLVLPPVLVHEVGREL